MQRELKCMKENKTKCREGCKSETGGAKRKKVNWALRDRLGRYWANKTNRTGLIQVNRTSSVQGIYRGDTVFFLHFHFPFSL